MANALQLDITVEMALQAAGRSDNLGRVRYDAADQSRAEGGTQVLLVADAVTDQAVGLGGITTASEVLIVSSQTIGLKVNGGAAVAGKVFMYSGAAITALAIDNSSGASAQVQVLLAGS